jgi:hypothetical protein
MSILFVVECCEECEVVEDVEMIGSFILECGDRLVVDCGSFILAAG